MLIEFEVASSCWMAGVFFNHVVVVLVMVMAMVVRGHIKCRKKKVRRADIKCKKKCCGEVISNVKKKGCGEVTLSARMKKVACMKKNALAGF